MVVAHDDEAHRGHVKPASISLGRSHRNSVEGIRRFFLVSNRVCNHRGSPNCFAYCVGLAAAVFQAKAKNQWRQSSKSVTSAIDCCGSWLMGCRVELQDGRWTAPFRDVGGEVSGRFHMRHASGQRALLLTRHSKIADRRP
jgi:hypothetical protein